MQASSGSGFYRHCNKKWPWQWSLRPLGPTLKSTSIPYILCSKPIISVHRPEEKIVLFKACHWHELNLLWNRQTLAGERKRQLRQANRGLRSKRKDIAFICRVTGGRLQVKNGERGSRNISQNQKVELLCQHTEKPVGKYLQNTSGDLQQWLSMTVKKNMDGVPPYPSVL